jgi:hypothetical protein
MAFNYSANQSIGAMLLVHDELDEAVRCYNSFKEFYDLEKIIILCNISRNKDYLHKTTKKEIGDWPDYVTKLISLNSGPREEQVNLRMEFYREYLNSIYETYRKIDSEFLMFLHPDHMIIRPFKTFELNADIEFSPINFYDKTTDEALMKVLSFKRRIKGYGLPSYYSKSGLIKTLDFMLKDSSKILRALIEIDYKFNYGDYAIPLIFDYLGLKVENKNLLRELSGRKKLIHVFKKPVLFHKVPKI